MGQPTEDNFDDLKNTLNQETAAAKLNLLRDEAEKRAEAGIYGQPDQTPVATPPATPVTVTFGKKKFTVGPRLYDGNICELFECSDSSANMIMKISKNTADNDLVQAEASALKALADTDAKSKPFVMQLPKLIDSFAINVKGSRRQANVLAKLDGEYFSLADVIKRYPQGLDYRDAVWMIRRALMILGYAHTHGIVHGAVTPEHFLIRPRDHGGMLLDWCYSVKAGSKVPAIVKKYRDIYPPEVFQKLPAGPATDIYMLAKCAVKLLGGDDVLNGIKIPLHVPQAFASLLHSCLFGGPPWRPQNAFELHDQFGEVMEKLVGKPQFRPFKM